MLVREYSKLFLAASNAYSLYHDAVGTQTQYIYIYVCIYIYIYIKRKECGDTVANYK